ncbi:MBL fold metallo-hydrolase [Hyphococcus sp.]|uniref:MBL fold metallo-hydrolase n=1 Tax=Hyphococcus sp. TaxID=2038636 RepID=UPI003CCC45EE
MKAVFLANAAAAMASLKSVLTALIIFTCIPGAGAEPTPVNQSIEWNRLRPLDHDPQLDSGKALKRPCAPGETVIMRASKGEDSASKLGLRQGQFVICTQNTDTGDLTVVDGAGNEWIVAQDDVNATRGFPANWLSHDRDYLIWSYSRDTIIFRESLGNSYEGNFFYLLLDIDEDDNVTAGFLIDSGTGYADLKPYLLPVIGDSPLTVVSTHSHWDHFGGHRHLAGWKNATLIGYAPRERYNPYPEPPEYDLDGLVDYFDLKDWPRETADYQLGTRKITIIPTPGHTRDAIAFYDARERLLFTNDTLYPGFLFIEDWDAYQNSIHRLDQFRKTNTVKWVLGGHVEMSAKKEWNGMHEIFFFGSNTHFAELPPNMPPDALPVVNALIHEQMGQSENKTPHYDARIIDREFHDIPYVPVPFPGIPSYYRINAQRLVDTLIERHRAHDLNDTSLSEKIEKE